MESFPEVVQLVKAHIKTQVSDVAYNCWIDPIEPVKLEQKQAVIFVKTPFQRDILLKQYADKLHEGFAQVLGFQVQVEIATEETLADFTEESPRITELPKDTPAGYYPYTFDTFIVGPSNNLAFAASKAVATQETGDYNPLFIYGPSGLGKTHLLMAIAEEVKRRSPEKNILSLSSEAFTNDLVTAIADRNMIQFHQKYRKADILLVDDVQFFAGKERVQEEFFHTFNELYQMGKPIVLTSDRPPKDIKTLEDRLRNRFEWGLIIDIYPPEYETRLAIINRKSALLQLDLPADISEFIATRLKTNIRQLEGAVKKMAAYQRYTNSSPSFSMAQTVIREILSEEQPLPITVERIIEEVAKTFSVTPDDIRSKKQSAAVSKARQTAIYVVREVTNMSMASIGEEFNRDHSTIVYAISQTRTNIERDARQREVVSDIIKNIKNQ